MDEIGSLIGVGDEGGGQMRMTSFRVFMTFFLHIISNPNNFHLAWNFHITTGKWVVVILLDEDRECAEWLITACMTIRGRKRATKRYWPWTETMGCKGNGAPSVHSSHRE